MEQKHGLYCDCVSCDQEFVETAKRKKEASPALSPPRQNGLSVVLGEVETRAKEVFCRHATGCICEMCLVIQDEFALVKALRRSIQQTVSLTHNPALLLKYQLELAAILTQAKGEKGKTLGEPGAV